METLVLEKAGGIYLTNTAKIVHAQTDISAEFSSAANGWKIEDSNPFVTWIAGDFVEADNPNQNKQFWTKGDLELADYSIRYAPLNMVHKFRQPIGFFAATNKIDLVRDDEAAKKNKKHAFVNSGTLNNNFTPAPTAICATCGLPASDPVHSGTGTGTTGTATAAEETTQGTMKIEALSGLWSHIFPFEAALTQQADDAGMLFYSMECRGTHLTCAGDEGCGETFEYMAVDSHCEHIKDRSSIRHIVNPTFRGGAIIVPPVKPGWSNASASIYSAAVSEEAAKFAEQNEEQYKSLVADGANLTASAWEMLMGQVIAVAGAKS